MARRKPFPHRPEKAFRVGAVSWNLQNVARHVNAGFAPMSDDIVRVHYYRYWQFLRAQGYLLKEVPPEPRGWDGELWSTDLTLEGYRFAQYSHDRWIGRILKFRDAPSDLVCLTKWHAKFAALPKETFAAYDA
jgi:hypothetical protein